MSEFQAPIKDIKFTLENICDLQAITQLSDFEGIDEETLYAALEEAGKLANDVLAPINHVGDQEGAMVENGVVRTPAGFKEAYATYRDGGWNAVPFDPAYGGMGLPGLFGLVCAELWNAANMGFALCPLLNQGAVEAITAHGTDAQKDLYLPKLISGEWSGTMNLTEPQAGSDVGALKSRAEPLGDGTWKITGTKIFITYGEHDFTDNIVHLVLARTPDSPAGTKGISLFIVPKFLVNDDGSLGQRNDLRCASLEHKLGIHASPTAVMAYGDNDGAIGTMLGAENQGMRAMFTMMNNARLAVGTQGVAIAERAYQQAALFAIERRQGRAIGETGNGPSAIVAHADVRRMLMTMKAYTEAVRAICYANAEALDYARHHQDPEQKQIFQHRADFLTPISKGFSTDVGCAVADIGVQIHGGMGFIEETGAAQHLRDARITPIYEGTNGIQALDLVMRKLSLAGGGIGKVILDDLQKIADELEQSEGDLSTLAAPLNAAITVAADATQQVLSRLQSAPNDAAAGAAPFLRLWGLTLGGGLLAKGALAADRMRREGHPDGEYLADRIAVAQFYAAYLLPETAGLLAPATAGADLLYRIHEDRLIA